MPFRDILQTLMQRHGNISISELAKASHIPQPTLYQLYTGVTSYPRQKTLATLAAFFSISIDQLTGQEPLPGVLSPTIKKQLNIHTTPIIEFQDLFDWPNSLNRVHKKELILEDMQSDLTFALEMKGRSMEPLFPPGCLLIFDANKIPNDQDCILIYLKNSNQFLVKKLLSDGHCAFIKSINPELTHLSTLPVSKEDKIMATLIEARIKF